MKLCKEVCKRCTERQGWPWGMLEEEYWERGSVYCRGHGLGGSGMVSHWASVQKRPPKGCPFAAEHAVSHIPKPESA